jgi:hypothetical protein
MDMSGYCIHYLLARYQRRDYVCQNTCIKGSQRLNYEVWRAKEEK